ncbi:pyridoxamine 5'-phosphate oxidase family protein [Zunongwangia sp. H14]|uniref:pyridoxamine 5'-phosphate oxidase family protein n=1 Tax=Zunongwangia sp. H14 TaxID=3240792 RepID=UPI00356634C6
MKNKITKEMLPAFQGVIPATLTTVSKDGVPNVTYVSQIFRIDKNHVAISNQFFNKTWQKIEVEFLSEEKKGEIFEEMEVVMSGISSMFDDKIAFKLKSAVICKILNIKTIYKP